VAVPPDVELAEVELPHVPLAAAGEAREVAAISCCCDSCAAYVSTSVSCGGALVSNDEYQPDSAEVGGGGEPTSVTSTSAVACGL
jgi:hypothetical protein